jgi:hypothetical protein
MLKESDATIERKNDDGSRVLYPQVVLMMYLKSRLYDTLKNDNMRRHFLFCLLLLLIMSSYKVYAHNTMVGKIIIEDFGEELLINAVMEKKYLTEVLTKETDCSPKEMLLHCGDAYLQRHIQFLVNGNNECLTFQSMEIQQDRVLFKYSIAAEHSKIESIGVSSDYMLSYEAHAMLKVEVNVGSFARSYNMKESRQKININL